MSVRNPLLLLEIPPYDSIKFPKTSGLDHLRESLQAEGISKRATTPEEPAHLNIMCRFGANGLA